MSKSFKLLLLAQSSANLADIFFRVVVISNIYLLTKSVLATSVIPVVFGLAAFVASFFVPLVSKRMPLNRILSLTQLVKTVVLLLLVIIFSFARGLAVPVVYLAVGLISFFDGFASPVSHAIIPQYSNDLAKANSLLNVADESIQVVGWGLGGALFALLGFSHLLRITLVLFLLATSFFFLLPQMPILALEQETDRESLIKGWKLIFKSQKLSLLLFNNLFEILANTIWVSSIILVFVTKVLRQGEGYWGYINTTYSLGIILGGLLIYRFSDWVNQRKVASIIFSLCLVALLTGLGVALPNVVFFLICSVGIGFFSQLKEIPETVLLQESVPEEYLVNVYSVSDVINTLAFSIFVIIMGGLTDSFGISFTFILAVICLLLEAIIFIIFRRKLV